MWPTHIGPKFEQNWTTIDNNSSAWKWTYSRPIRNNLDKIFNDRGSNLLDLCISIRLRILNGRKPGDSIGYYTCHKYNGSSVVDYCLVTECIFQDILYFHVHTNISDLSDHCQISTCIKNVHFTKEVLPKLETSPINRGFIWEENSEILFQRAHRTLDKSITAFLNTQFECLPGDIDTALGSCNEIVLNAANQSLRKSRGKQRGKQNKRIQKTSNKWYGPSLRQMKSEIKKPWQTTVLQTI
jgi:hypothetical protein